MKVSTEPSTQHQLHVGAWVADDSMSVVRILRRQIVAASALWPELKHYEIVNSPPVLK